MKLKMMNTKIETKEKFISDRLDIEVKIEEGR